MKGGPMVEVDLKDELSGAPVRRATREQRLPPGPRLPVPIQTLLWGTSPTGFLSRAQRRYGDIFTIRLPLGTRIVVLADPGAVREAMAVPADAFAASELAPILEPFLGTRSLVLLDGARHHRERKLLSRAFHGEGMQTYASLIEGAVERDLETWPTGRAFALHPHMQAITLEVMLQAVFGIADPDELARFRARLRSFLLQGGSPFVLAPPTRRDLGRWSPWGRFVRLRADVHRMVAEEIAARRSTPDLNARRDILSLLIRADDDDGRELDDSELRDELMTMLLAGHDTTATALSWAFDLLVHHPPVLGRLVSSLRAGEQTYLDAVIKEVLRLRPTVTDFARPLTRPITIAGHELPAGAILCASIVLLHRRADLYPEPLAFRPERFLGGPADLQTWIPFGGGIRRCLGAGFANLEMRAVLQTILARMTLGAATARPERPRRRAVTLTPRGGTRIIARPLR
jgi:cytochrome P450